MALIHQGILGNARNLARQPSPPVPELKAAIKGMLNLFEEDYAKAVATKRIEENVAALRQRIADLERQLGMTK